MHSSLVHTVVRQKRLESSNFKASLVCTASSRAAMGIQKALSQENKQTSQPGMVAVHPFNPSTWEEASKSL